MRVGSVVTAAIYRTSGGVPDAALFGLASVDAFSLPDDPVSPFSKTELAMFHYDPYNIRVTAGEQMAMILSATEPRTGEDGAAYYGAPRIWRRPPEP
ncbi:MAG: hypothetical protein JO217_07025 [Acidobacteriaceae bacterium]|nr:hypothetical protein [Acidobacteriaceae bacterium]MBV9442431.1 hypothetical protein [Acidobacteriaceae bacterium]